MIIFSKSFLGFSGTRSRRHVFTRHKLLTNQRVRDKNGLCGFSLTYHDSYGTLYSVRRAPLRSFQSLYEIRAKLILSSTSHGQSRSVNDITMCRLHRLGTEKLLAIQFPKSWNRETIVNDAFWSKNVNEILKASSSGYFLFLKQWLVISHTKKYSNQYFLWLGFEPYKNKGSSQAPRHIFEWKIFIIFRIAYRILLLHYRAILMKLNDNEVEVSWWTSHDLTPLKQWQAL